MAIQKISNAVIADDAVSADNIATGAITVADIPDGEITNAKIDTVAASKVTGEISTSQIGDTAVTNAKIDTVASTKVTGRVQDNEDLPNIRPSLLLDFANQKTLDPRITFTRDSTATYYDGVTTVKAEQNLIPYSQDFTQSQYEKQDVNLTVNAATAPDGSNTASLIVDNTNNNYHQLDMQSFSVAGTGTAVASIFVKAAGRTQFYIYANYGAVRSQKFDISNGTLDGYFTGGIQSESASITSAGNGWYRISMQFPKNNVSGQLVFALYNASGNFSSPYTGDNSSGAYVWGAQLEMRDSVTSYTPTTSVPITKYQPRLMIAEPDKPRFDHNPITNESKGLLIEEQRTNLLSESVAQSTSWGGNFTTSGGEYVIPDEAIAPDGTKTAAKIGYVYSAGQQPRLNLTGITLGANTYTMSFYAKAGEWNYISASFFYNSYAYLTVDLSDGSVHNANISANDYSIQDVGNGWYKIVLTYTSAGTLNNNPTGLWPSGTGLDAGFNTAGESVDANGYNGVYVWGAQIEVGSFATSYIPSNGTTVTRPIDQLLIDDISFVNQTEGTFYSEVDLNQVARVGGGASERRHIFGLRPVSGSIQDGWITGYYDATSFDMLSYGNLTNDYLTIANADYGVHKGAQAYLDQGTTIDTFSCLDGGTVAENSPGAISRNLSFEKMDIGSSFGNIERALSGYLRKLAYYPKRLPNAQLQALTED